MTTKATPPSRAAWRAFALLPYMCIGAIFLLAATYAFPQTDDFCQFGRLNLLSGDNPFVEAWYMYTHWAGRYTANFAVPLVGWLTGILPIPTQWVYAAALMLFIIAFLWSCLRLTRVAAEFRASNAILAWLLFGASLALMPSKLEGVLWVTGVAVYSIGLALLACLFDAIDRDDANPMPTAGRASPLSLALIVLATGTNEFVGLILGGYLMLRLATRFRWRPVYPRQELMYWCTYAASLAVSIFAPGNFTRDATISVQRHDMDGALRLATDSFTAFANAHLAPQAFLLIALMVAACAAGWVRRLPPAHWRRVLPVAASLVAGFPLHLFVYSFLTGEAAPGRVINQAYALSILGAGLAAGWTGAYLASRKPLLARRPALAIIGLAGLVLITASPMRNFTQSVRTYAPTWKAEQLARENRLNSYAGNRNYSVGLSKFTREPTNPPAFHGADAGDDPSYWVNRCMADYYRLGAIEVH